uniref:SFRICE_007424 n=1 Tax=Spodoptera frugiperda TaxID=7108 RepID=A0A2H1W7Z1_SPOFR
MSQTANWNANGLEKKPQILKNYCFVCLCSDEEKNLQKYVFQCCSLKEVLQMDSMMLCYLCRRMAQYAESFTQSVQSNQLLLENFQNIMDETLKSVRTQTHPLVNLSSVSLNVIDVTEKDGSAQEESFSVVCSRSRDSVQIKVEMKEEEFMEQLEGDFVGGCDDYQEPFVKDEDDAFTLDTSLKEELQLEDIDGLNLLALKSTLKKNKINKKKTKIKREDDFPDDGKIQRIYITREQCLEEKAKMLLDPKYIEAAFKCGDCAKHFTFKDIYDKHMEKHSQSIGEYECDICKLRMESEDKLVGHMKYHTNRYKCLECGLTRTCRRTILDHVSAYHSEVFHLCPYCSKSFKRQSSIRKHVSQMHRARARVTCAHCHRTYKDNTALRTHMLLKHAKEISAREITKKYACQECGMAFKTPSQLKTHGLKHTDSRDYYCVECDKSFKSDATLKTHLKTTAIHTSYLELPLACEHCDKRFAIRRDLDRHTNRIHLNVKPFACDKCDKNYVNSWSLKQHQLLIHEGYKRPLAFPCSMCDKIFDRKQVLKAHIRTHTGERPYQCSKCPAQFSQSSILRTHDRLIHLKQTRDGRPKVK